jgi:DNA-binding NarL/FixJ family response regulator
MTTLARWTSNGSALVAIVNGTARPDRSTFTPARRLTGQQRRVLVLLIGGVGYKRIAQHMGISERTVRLHVHRAAQGLPGEGSPRTKLLLWAEALLAA